MLIGIPARMVRECLYKEVYVCSNQHINHEAHKYRSTPMSCYTTRRADYLEPQVSPVLLLLLHRHVVFQVGKRSNGQPQCLSVPTIDGTGNREGSVQVDRL